MGSFFFSLESMKYEIQYAASFWASKLNPNLGEETISTFQSYLMVMLEDKYSAHWYPDCPMRGQAYREVCCDVERELVDDTLNAAAHKAGFYFLHHFFSQRGLRMWVDPGEVEVALINNPRNSQIIYQAGVSNISPPPRSPSPVYYPHSDINYYESLSHTEPNLAYYPDSQQEPCIFLSDTDYNDGAYDYGSYTPSHYSVQHDLPLRM